MYVVWKFSYVLLVQNYFYCLPRAHCTLHKIVSCLPWAGHSGFMKCIALYIQIVHTFKNAAIFQLSFSRCGWFSSEIRVEWIGPKHESAVLSYLASRGRLLKTQSSNGCTSPSVTPLESFLRCQSSSPSPNVSWPEYPEWRPDLTASPSLIFLELVVDYNFASSTATQELYRIACVRQRRNLLRGRQLSCYSFFHNVSRLVILVSWLFGCQFYVQ